MSRYNMQYSTTCHGTAQHVTVQHNHTSAAQHVTVQPNMSRYSPTCHSTAQHVTVQHNMSRYSPTCHSTAQHVTTFPTCAVPSTLTGTAQHVTVQHNMSQYSTTLSRYSPTRTQYSTTCHGVTKTHEHGLITAKPEQTTLLRLKSDVRVKKRCTTGKEGLVTSIRTPGQALTGNVFRLNRRSLPPSKNESVHVTDRTPGVLANDPDVIFTGQRTLRRAVT
ncbi:hypothetical protein Btru_054596 [Bulinus truncatus]|nr:hypothetical protein Btru_054596 [Bulinus truncatus]